MLFVVRGESSTANKYISYSLHYCLFVLISSSVLYIDWASGQWKHDPCVNPLFRCLQMSIGHHISQREHYGEEAWPWILNKLRATEVSNGQVKVVFTLSVRVWGKIYH
jgi:hypothetical protein